ncbi:unnamed protein product [Urochloa decumbens]|uniref:F-box domain-containing protein n=1 Tax=Urochloa decumbens TaxID=240449 RepID=A0ABC9ATG9_9POAL
MGSNDSGAAATAGDRLSRLSDAVLGHVLSFLPADEAARAAVLSRQWRHVFAHVHTVALDEPDPHIPDYDGDWSPGYGGPVDRNAAAPSPPFTNAVSSALFRRLRGGGGAASVLLRALRVAFHKFSGLNAGLVDMWLWYAVQQAGKDGELHLDLQLRRSAAPCGRIYSLRRAGGAEEPPEAAMDDEDPASPRFELAVAADVDVALPATSPLSSDGDAADDEPPPPLYKNEYRLASACPRLADLTLESCNSNLTKLTVLDKRLRRLALRCCHGLAAVAVASSELRAFEYRGAIPEPWFLTLHGGARRISSCAIDICGAEAAEPPELARLGAFLRLFPGVERLSLTSARLGGGAPAFPTFPKLRHLELTGMVPDDDTGAVATVTRILRRTPRLDALTLFFLPEVEELQEGDYQDIDEEELLDGHTLKYDRHAPLDVPEIDIPCLREGTKEINFVHYEGGLAQRKLAKFLLRNAPVVGEVCGEFAVGPLWIQTRLMEEIKEWVMNKSANMMFF